MATAVVGVPAAWRGLGDRPRRVRLTQRPLCGCRYEGFRHYITGSYKLNCIETMTGLKLVLTTDNVGDIQQDLRDIYKVRRAARARYTAPTLLSVPRLYRNPPPSRPSILTLNFQLPPAQLYIEYAVKNPCYTCGEPIQLEMFKDKLDDYIRKLPYFR